ncbi:MAG: hypothetical protein LUF91_00770 [Oscillospiraceae bacterium]|nr:hypothetical protein [Oscillospiraceae bacterium]
MTEIIAMVCIFAVVLILSKFFDETLNKWRDKRRNQKKRTTAKSKPYRCPCRTLFPLQAAHFAPFVRFCQILLSHHAFSH